MNRQNAKRRILVVDDEPDNASIFRIALEDNGFDVASSGSNSISSLGRDITFIRKPVQLDELVKKVNETIKKK